MHDQNEENYSSDSVDFEGEQREDGPQNVPSDGLLWTDEVRRLAMRQPQITDLGKNYPPIRAEILGVYCEVKPTALYLALATVQMQKGTRAARDAHFALVRQVRSDVIKAAYGDAMRGVWKNCRKRALSPFEQGIEEWRKAAERDLDGYW
jgi:hypothetical protein